MKCGVRNSESRRCGTCGGKCRSRRAHARQGRDRSARCGVSARAETAKSADAVKIAQNGCAYWRREAHYCLTGFRFPERCTREWRISAYPLSECCQFTANCRFFSPHPDSKFLARDLTRNSRLPQPWPQGSTAFPCRRPKRSPPARRAPARADRPFKGIALILSSTVFLGISDVTAKYVSASLPSIEIAWLRFLVFAMIMVPAMVPGSPLFALKTGSVPLQLMRGAALLGSSLFFISGLRYLPIAEASATGFVSPLFVTALSIIFLSEKVGVRRWLATAVGSARRADHPAPGQQRISSRGRLSDRLRARLGLHADHDAHDERQGARHHHHDLFVDRGRLRSSQCWCRSSG